MSGDPVSNEFAASRLPAGQFASISGPRDPSGICLCGTYVKMAHVEVAVRMTERVTAQCS